MEKVRRTQILWLYCCCIGLVLTRDPIGIHLGLGDDPFSERVIQWTSSNAMEQVNVSRLVGIQHVKHNANAIDYQKLPINRAELNWIHKATIKNLTQDSTYYYELGQKQLSFQSWKQKTKIGYSRDPMTFLFYGAVADANGQKPPANDQLVEHQLYGRHYDAVVNLGALTCNRSLITYLEGLQYVAGSVVYLTTPGPNERKEGYELYSQLFSMPNVPWPMTQFWYSFDTEFAHIVSFTTEVYYPEDDPTRIRRQMEWLRNDLKIANDQRTGFPGSLPWIIAYSHRSLYCSVELQCTKERKRFAELEEFFYEFGVDLIITTQHDVYERTWPVYKDVKKNSHYENPRAPVHVSSAAFTCTDVSSNSEKNVKILDTPPEWTAYKRHLNGQPTFGILTIINRTHLLWQENYADAKLRLFDHFYIVQTNHGSFGDPVSRAPKATTVILAIVIVILVVMISGFLYLRIKAFIRRRQAEQKMSYVNLTSSLEL